MTKSIWSDCIKGDKQMKGLTLVAAMLCLAGIAMANPPTPNVGTNRNPPPYDNLVFYGANVYRVEASTPTAVAVQLGVGSGILYSVVCSSGLTGEFGIAADTSVTTGLSLSPLPSGVFISPLVYTSIPTANESASAFGQWAPPFLGTRFSKGLAFIKSDASALENCLVYAIFDANTSGTSH
jgi:hypothetical protein